MLKILQARLQQSVNCELPDVQAGFRKGIVNKAKVEVFLELACFLDDPVDIGNLISGSSAFSKSSLNIWTFTIHVMLKAGLENFEYYFASMWSQRVGHA